MEVVSDPDCESQLTLHANWGKVKLAFFTVSLEKCDFLQTTPNICNIYTNSKISKSPLIFRWFRVEIRCCLAEKPRPSWEKGPNSGKFHRESGVPSWRAWNFELSTVKNGWKKCSTAPEYKLEVYRGERRVTLVRRRLSSSDDMAPSGCSSAASGSADVGRAANRGGEKLERRWPWLLEKKRRRRRRGRRRRRRRRGKRANYMAKWEAQVPLVLIGQFFVFEMPTLSFI